MPAICIVKPPKHIPVTKPIIKMTGFLTNSAITPLTIKQPMRMSITITLNVAIFLTMPF